MVTHIEKYKSEIAKLTFKSTKKKKKMHSNILQIEEVNCIMNPTLNDKQPWCKFKSNFNHFQIWFRPHIPSIPVSSVSLCPYKRGKNADNKNSTKRKHLLLVEWVEVSGKYENRMHTQILWPTKSCFPIHYQKHNVRHIEHTVKEVQRRPLTDSKHPTSRLHDIWVPAWPLQVAKHMA